MARKATAANIPKVEQAVKALNEKKQELILLKTKLEADTEADSAANKALDTFYKTGTQYGLTKKEREAQFKKSVSLDSHGYKRRSEADMYKTDMIQLMLRRAVKNGFVANYVLTDSWFFSESLVECIKSIKNGCIKLVSMVRINNQIFELLGNKGLSNVRSILQNNLKNQVRCKSKKAHYIKVRCKYEGYVG